MVKPRGKPRKLKCDVYYHLVVDKGPKQTFRSIKEVERYFNENKENAPVDVSKHFSFKRPASL